MPTALSTRKAISRILTPRVISATSPAEEAAESAATRGASTARRVAEVGQGGRVLVGGWAAGRTEDGDDVRGSNGAHRRLESRRERRTRRCERKRAAEVDEVWYLLAGRPDDLVEVDLHVEQRIGVVALDDVGCLLGEGEAGQRRQAVCQ